MKVEIELKETSQSIVHEAKNTYQKGEMYCVYMGDIVYKYPLSNIFMIKEDYKSSVDLNIDVTIDYDLMKRSLLNNKETIINIIQQTCNNRGENGPLG